MFEQTHIPVINLAATRRFYDATALPLGLGTVAFGPRGFALGRLGNAAPMIWIGTDRPLGCQAITALGKSDTLISFSAETREAVEAFHRAALTVGGENLQDPASLKHQPNLYAAFVRDPSGNAIEACFTAQ